MYLRMYIFAMQHYTMLTITLTSDFGYNDYNVALTKGQMLQHLNDTAQFIDVTHNVANYNLPQAAYFIQSILPHYIAPTYHCVLVNLFENKSKRLLCLEQKGQYIFSADNGFINLINEQTKANVYAIDLNIGTPLNTINYIQTMAKCINWLHSGNPITTIGEPVTDYVDKIKLKPRIEPDYIEGYIIFIDSYENVVTNISQKLFYEVKKNRNFKIVFKRNEVIETISESYADVPQGEKLALFNTSGYLEIAINQGNAAGLFGLLSFTSGANTSASFLQKGLYYQTVKVYFE
jgi:S-adenosyl-L-methionine hydrolase (adenosine-forming)